MATHFKDVKPFPAAKPADAGIGHNRPPVEEQGVADFNEMIDGHKGIRQRIRELVDSSKRASATNDETAGLCAELVRQMAAVEKAVDTVRTTVKAPYLNAGRSIDDAAKTLIGDLSSAKTKVRHMTESFMRDKLAKEAAERQKREAERAAERKRLEEQAQTELLQAAEENREPDPEVIAAPITVSARPEEAEPTQIRSDFGAVASARRVKVANITDWKKAFNAVKSVPAVQQAVQTAVNALMRAGQTNIPGVEIKEDVGLSVR